LFKWFQDIATLLLLIVILYIVYVFMFALIPPPIESFWCKEVGSVRKIRLIHFLVIGRKQWRNQAKPKTEGLIKN
jgi:hypothetical protein